MRLYWLVSVLLLLSCVIFESVIAGAMFMGLWAAIILPPVIAVYLYLSALICAFSDSRFFIAFWILWGLPAMFLHKALMVKIILPYYPVDPTLDLTIPLAGKLTMALLFLIALSVRRWLALPDLKSILMQIERVLYS